MFDVKGSRITSATVTWNATKNGYISYPAKPKGNAGDPGVAAWSYTYSRSDTASDVVWNGTNSSGGTHKVGKKSPTCQETLLNGAGIGLARLVRET